MSPSFGNTIVPKALPMRTAASAICKSILLYLNPDFLGVIISDNRPEKNPRVNEHHKCAILDTIKPRVTI